MAAQQSFCPLQERIRRKLSYLRQLSQRLYHSIETTPLDGNLRKSWIVLPKSAERARYQIKVSQIVKTNPWDLGVPLEQTSPARAHIADQCRVDR